MAGNTARSNPSGKGSNSRTSRTATGSQPARAWRPGRPEQPKAYSATITYGGTAIPVGTWAHWQLMELACRAKFAENAQARAALLSTGTRPLTHVVRQDSKAIPGVIMAEIWMRLRRDLTA